MIFSKQAIQQAIEQKLITVSPFEESQVESAHINLHIDNEKDLKIAPKEFVLASTKETVTFTDTICGFVEGRASLAKQGISIEQSSTFIEPGTDNKITLEMFNASDKEVTIEAGQEIAKLFITKFINNI